MYDSAGNAVIYRMAEGRLGKADLPEALETSEDRVVVSRGTGSQVLPRGQMYYVDGGVAHAHGMSHWDFRGEVIVTGRTIILVGHLQEIDAEGDDVGGAVPYYCWL